MDALLGKIEHINCSQALQPIPADPDIAGIGVLLSFIITAAISVILAIVVDVSRRILEWRRKRQRDETISGRLAYVVNIFRPVLLSLSDQHLILGNAILAAALIKLSEISSYHLGIALGLAGLSASTHTLILWSLWPDINRSPTVYLRILLMACQAILTFYLLSRATSTDGSAASYKLIPCSRWGNNEKLLKYAVLTEQYIEFSSPFVLLFAAVLSIISYRGPGGIARRGLKALFPSMYDAKTGRLAVSKKPMLNTAMRVFTGFYLLLVILLLLANLRYAKALGGMNVVIIGSEQEWGFGQLVPQFLLALPALSLFMACCEPQESPADYASLEAHSSDERLMRHSYDRNSTAHVPIRSSYDLETSHRH